jgi:hypothetical protein
MIEASRILATNSQASERDGVEAVKLAECAIQLTGGRSPVCLDSLAAAYAEARRFPEAIETARRTLSLAEQRDQDVLADALNAKIKL